MYALRRIHIIDHFFVRSLSKACFFCHGEESMISMQHAVQRLSTRELAHGKQWYETDALLKLQIDLSDW